MTPEWVQVSAWTEVCSVEDAILQVHREGPAGAWAFTVLAPGMPWLLGRHRKTRAGAKRAAVGCYLRFLEQNAQKTAGIAEHHALKLWRARIALAGDDAAQAKSGEDR